MSRFSATRSVQPGSWHAMGLVCVFWWRLDIRMHQLMNFISNAASWKTYLRSWGVQYDRWGWQVCKYMFSSLLTKKGTEFVLREEGGMMIGCLFLRGYSWTIWVSWLLKGWDWVDMYALLPFRLPSTEALLLIEVHLHHPSKHPRIALSMVVCWDRGSMTGQNSQSVVPTSQNPQRFHRRMV
jgi:hypothetical protein